MSAEHGPVEGFDRARALLDGAGCVVAFSGAGLSAESGVSTFRDAENMGLWSKYDPTRLASPEGFAADRELVMDWYRMRRKQIAEASPNAAHVALGSRPDIVNVTQNVDDLLRRAGVDDPIQLHGRIDIDRCHGGCGYSESIDLGDPPPLRRCPNCDGDYLRPGVIWFGEALDSAVWNLGESACVDADVLLVVGTSAVVYPAAGLIGLAQSRGAKVIVINTQSSEASSVADVDLRGSAVELLPSLLSK